MGRNSGGVSSNGHKQASAAASHKNRLAKMVKSEQAKLAKSQAAFDSHVKAFMGSTNGTPTMQLAKKYAAKVMQSNHQETPQVIKLRINKLQKALSKL